MKKILLSFFLLLFLPYTGGAFEDNCERGVISDYWVTGYYISSYYTDPSGRSDTVLYIGAGGSGDDVSITSINTLNPAYFSFIFLDGACGASNKYNINYLNPTTGATQVQISITDATNKISDNSKVEIIREGSYFNVYSNGVLISSTADPGGVSENVKVSFSFYSASSFTKWMYIDDITDGSMIGTGKIYYESATSIPITWSAKLMRSYETQHEISLYSITNPNNAGKIISWNIPQDDNATTNEYGYFSFSRSGVLGDNHGLYLLEMTRGSIVLTDTYFYYDQLANPQGYPEVLFLASSDVDAEIIDEDVNGGEIAGGGSVYLYPEINENGIYNITYNIKETPFSISVTLTKIYNNTALNGTNIHFTGLSGQNYYVSVDSTPINGTNGADTWDCSLHGTRTHTLFPLLQIILCRGYGVMSKTQTRRQQ
ncbi:hypothetical protein [Methanosarcina horonobensis]|uniref:hypothetical protein n=1 Tax=Methanosarcina horonobensis TaxID=418008 RepID=UPI000A6FFC97|nr:hypothetical protein [Methanosarcina horonobensis]